MNREQRASNTIDLKKKYYTPNDKYCLDMTKYLILSFYIILLFLYCDTIYLFILKNKILKKSIKYKFLIDFLEKHISLNISNRKNFDIPKSISLCAHTPIFCYGFPFICALFCLRKIDPKRKLHLNRFTFYIPVYSILYTRNLVLKKINGILILKNQKKKKKK